MVASSILHLSSKTDVAPMHVSIQPHILARHVIYEPKMNQYELIKNQYTTCTASVVVNISASWTSFFGDVSVAQLVASASGVVLGGVAKCLQHLSAQFTIYIYIQPTRRLLLYQCRIFFSLTDNEVLDPHRLRRAFRIPICPLLIPCCHCLHNKILVNW